MWRSVLITVTVTGNSQKDVLIYILYFVQLLLVLLITSKLQSFCRASWTKQTHQYFQISSWCSYTYSNIEYIEYRSLRCHTLTECALDEWDTLWQSQGGSVTRSGLNMRTLPFSLLSFWRDWWWAFGLKPFVIGWTLKAKWSPWEGRWEAELQGGDREVVITKANTTRYLLIGCPRHLVHTDLRSAVSGLRQMCY